jgi:hypothetical protein
LNTFAREVSKKTGKRQTGTIDSRFADFSFEAEGGSNQFELQSIRVPRVEFADRDKR